MINLHYIRAAIQQATGTRLTLERTRELLVEEGLITQKQADNDADLFKGYSDYYYTDTAEAAVDDLDTEMGLPE